MGEQKTCSPFFIFKMKQDTIVALSTPFGKGAVAIVRMSGEESLSIAKQLFRPFPAKPGYLQVGKLKTEYFTDQAMCVFFEAPHSFNGENMVEFHCHGGMALVEGVLKACCDKGARMAVNGEFSKRAFLNGKMNLTNAEGMIEMIDAETSTGVRSGFELLQGRFGREITAMQDRLTDVLAKIEVTLDYPEEDLEEATVAETRIAVKELVQQTEKLLQGARKGRLVKYGVTVAIVGKPNVGKSSLLNALINSDKAIVSDEPGTTRDVVEQAFCYRDTRFHFMDTAGIHETENKIEQQGISKSKTAAETADVVLAVIPAHEPLSAEDVSVLELVRKTEHLVVKNKADLGKKCPEEGIFVSAATGEGLEELKQNLYDRTVKKALSGEDLVLTNLRHIGCLERAGQSLEQSLEAVSLDVAAMLLKEAWTQFGEITGNTASVAVIDRIFAKFCVGK